MQVLGSSGADLCTCATGMRVSKRRHVVCPGLQDLDFGYLWVDVLFGLGIVVCIYSLYWTSTAPFSQKKKKKTEENWPETNHNAFLLLSLSLSFFFVFFFFLQNIGILKVCLFLYFKIILKIKKMFFVLNYYFFDVLKLF